MVCLVGVATVTFAATQLLDSVVARVGGVAITQTDVDAALALGVVEAAPGQQRIAAGTRQLIYRQLLLAEVARFPPPEPPEIAVAERAAAMKAHAGDAYEALVRRTGVDEERLRELARDSLRIEAYVDQRFGIETAQRREAMVAQWLEDLRMRGDVIEITPRP